MKPLDALGCSPVPSAEALVAVSLTSRVQALVSLFERVKQGGMQDLGLLHPKLWVQAVGFTVLEPQPEAPTPVGTRTPPPNPVAQGVLITPWFMNLVRFPLRAQTTTLNRIGSRTEHPCGAEKLSFLHGHDQVFGGYESCALFSPMNDFGNQAHAIAVAQEVLLQLRRAPAHATPMAHADPSPNAPIQATWNQPLADDIPRALGGKPARPSRRGFLTGRTRV